MQGQRKKIAIGSASIVALISICVFAFVFRMEQLSSAKNSLNAASLLKQANSERAKVGSGNLALNNLMNESAQAKANDMVERNYYGHISPDGVQGYEYINKYLPNECEYISENLIQSGEGAQPEGIFAGWMNSQSHREAILDKKYSLTGFGIAKKPDGSLVIVEHFCSKM